MAKDKDPVCDISVIICASQEGKLLHRTLATAAESMARAGLSGYSSELILVLHDPDGDTATFARDRGGMRGRILEVDGSRIEARNVAVHRAHGKRIAWLDAGDICGPDWLNRAVAAAEGDGRPDVVWHPQHCLILGDTFVLREYADHELAPREPATFFWTPPYPYAAFADTALYRRYPFRTHDVIRGYLRGEWYWGNETLAQGILHKVVPETYVGLRPDAPPSRINFGPAPPDLRPAPLDRPGTAPLPSVVTEDAPPASAAAAPAGS
ncbi:glycosyltransferase [Azospirillum halopraeferens]|uniref:glycosyltransferase n=1 Tax=Azospirillum halopraeferens TaxID=34010 RepID=UPI000422505B|nr:glycosyltransferase family A protein [Azospirillum halopraeferens]